MKTVRKTVPFNVFIPALPPLTLKSRAEFVETIQVEVDDNGQHQFLTTSASIQINASRVKALYIRNGDGDFEAIRRLLNYEESRR